ETEQFGRKAGRVQPRRPPSVEFRDGLSDAENPPGFRASPGPGPEGPDCTKNRAIRSFWCKHRELRAARRPKVRRKRSNFGPPTRRTQATDALWGNFTT